MPQTVRKYWGLQGNRVALNMNWGAIDASSTVIVSASEYIPETDPDAHGGFTNADHQRFIGAANITVSEIAPHGPPWDGNKGVTFVIQHDWGSPINIVTDITVLDDRPIDTQN
ncbi:hypothetical protein ACIOD2_30860 [Amycolatopsis sp. NPDC088138]|uniref:hypothetical protein n=1 Tax=Amycolatopsis sp. NPDC088138 TaxID=3363938 RepID=UPI00382B6C30